MGIFNLEAVAGTYDSHSAALKDKKRLGKIFADYKYKIEKTGNQDFPYRVTYTLKKGHTEPGSEKRLKELERL